MRYDFTSNYRDEMILIFVYTDNHTTENASNDLIESARDLSGKNGIIVLVVNRYRYQGLFVQCASVSLIDFFSAIYIFILGGFATKLGSNVESRCDQLVLQPPRPIFIISYFSVGGGVNRWFPASFLCDSNPKKSLNW